MSQHPPHHHDPAHRADPPDSGPTPIDLVAGDPPVPITVWRTAGTDPEAGRSIGARLAYRLVAAYSRPGEAVVDLTDDHALTGACAAGRRRHHPAWFTAPTNLIIGAATPTDGTHAGPPVDGDPQDVRAWFGDDLTDPDLPAATAPTAARDGASAHTATSLVVATWPLDAADAANRVKLAWLLTACARLLRPGGCLVLVITTAAADSATAPEDLSPVVSAAAEAGLGYLQHIVAVAADTTAEGDAFVYHVTDEELIALATDNGGGQPWAAAHLRVHADLLVFSQTPVPRPASRPKQGGGRRG